MRSLCLQNLALHFFNQGQGLTQCHMCCATMHIAYERPTVHEEVRRVQPTRCKVSQFIYFCKTLYMFQTVFPSIIRSSKLHIQRQVFVRPLLLPAASLVRKQHPGQAGTHYLIATETGVVWAYRTAGTERWAEHKRKTAIL